MFFIKVVVLLTDDSTKLQFGLPRGTPGVFGLPSGVVFGAAECFPGLLAWGERQALTRDRGRTPAVAVDGGLVVAPRHKRRRMVDGAVSSADVVPAVAEGDAADPDSSTDSSSDASSASDESSA